LLQFGKLRSVNQTYPMTIKKISLKSLAPIFIGAGATLEAINGLRNKYGKNNISKAPILLQDVVRLTEILKPRNKEHGQIDLSLHYAHCVRNFPNFGLDIISKSDIKIVGDDIAITVDVEVAGNKKWQKSELQECSDVLRRADLQITLNYVCDESTDAAGHSTILSSKNTTINKIEHSYIPISNFVCSFI
jgi:hypothetical protein